MTLALPVLALLLAWPVTAQAQGGPCLPRAVAIAKLAQTYQEQQVGIGVTTRGGSVVELFVSERGTWTILMTRADGISCITAAGENWSPIAPELGLAL
jgi:hypothetical protein